MSDPPSLSAVVPAHDARHFLERSLPPLLAQQGRELLEVLVVDDASTDGSGALAEALGARVLDTGTRGGPGRARNLGAREARGELLLFVDADVVVHADAAARLRAALRTPDVVAAFGSYDDVPPEPNFVSQYMNLRHHLVHQRGGGEASSFWAGLGAVRRADFLACGGFDAERYARPSIEDIELGYRLRARGGRIRLVPEAQGMHLKRWTLREQLRTDLFRRALPWSRLLLASPQAVAALNVAPGERLRAGVAAAWIASALLWAAGALPAWAPLALLGLAAALSWPLLRLVGRRNGLLYALGALLFHQAYYLYSSAAWAWCQLEHRLRATPS